MIRTKGEAGSGNIVEAVRHIRTIVKEMKQLTVLGKEELVAQAKNLQAPLELVEWVAEHGTLPVPNFSAGGIATPGGCGAGDAAGRGGGVRGFGDLQILRPGCARQGDCAGGQELQQPGEPAGRQPCAGRSHAGAGYRQDAGIGVAANPGLVMKTVGVLSLQGDFAAHGAALERAGARPVYVREREQLEGLDGLVIPGGESTTMLKLLRYDGLFDGVGGVWPPQADFRDVRGRHSAGQPRTGPAQESLGLMDLEIERNAYGRQIDSRVAALEPEAEFQRARRRRANWKRYSSARP